MDTRVLENSATSRHTGGYDQVLPGVTTCHQVLQRPLWIPAISTNTTELKSLNGPLKVRVIVKAKSSLSRIIFRAEPMGGHPHSEKVGHEVATQGGTTWSFQVLPCATSCYHVNPGNQYQPYSSQIAQRIVLSASKPQSEVVFEKRYSSCRTHEGTPAL